MKRLAYGVLWLLAVFFSLPALIGTIDVMSWFWTGSTMSSIAWNTERIFMIAPTLLAAAGCLMIAETLNLKK